MHFYLSRNGDTTGPVSLGQLNQSLSEGQISDTDLVFFDGLSDWVHVSSISTDVEFFCVTTSIFKCILKQLEEPCPENLSPEDFKQSYQKVKSELGNVGVQEKLNLELQDLEALERCFKDVANHFKLGSDSTSPNGHIACLRLFDWFQTMGNRTFNVEIALPASLDSDESLGQKQVRALELIIRSLIDERYGGSQDELKEAMEIVFGEEVVQEWLKNCDPDNLLSGTNFSLLASIFCDREGFRHHQPIYEEADVLSYIKRNKRKTIQFFLDDIRRIRNRFAHNKDITLSQLELLNIYYEELVVPIGQFHEHGHTKVNPNEFLDVTQEELNEYFSSIKEDMMEVKETIEDLKKSIEESSSKILDGQGEIKKDTRKVPMILGGIAAILVLGFVLFWLVVGQGETIQKAADTNQQVASAVSNQTTQVAEIGKDTKKTLNMAEAQGGKIDQLVEATGQIKEGVDELGQLGSLIANPKTPQGWFNNASIHKRNNNLSQTREAVEKCLNLNPSYLDPWILYFEVVVQMEGPKAQDIFKGQMEKTPAKPAQLVNARFKDGQEKIDVIKAFIDANADYLPAYCDFFKALHFKSVADAQQYMKKLMLLQARGSIPEIKILMEQQDVNKLAHEKLVKRYMDNYFKYGSHKKLRGEFIHEPHAWYDHKTLLVKSKIQTERTDILEERFIENRFLRDFNTYSEHGFAPTSYSSLAIKQPKKYRVVDYNEARALYFAKESWRVVALFDRRKGGAMRTCPILIAHKSVSDDVIKNLRQQIPEVIRKEEQEKQKDILDAILERNRRMQKSAEVFRKRHETQKKINDRIILNYHLTLEMDANGDGKTSRKEWEKASAQSLQRDHVKANAEWKVMDTNADGFVVEAEYRNFLFRIDPALDSSF